MRTISSIITRLGIVGQPVSQMYTSKWEMEWNKTVILNHFSVTAVVGVVVLHFNPNRVFQLIIWFNHLFTSFFFSACVRVCMKEKNYSKIYRHCWSMFWNFLKQSASLLWIQMWNETNKTAYKSYANIICTPQAKMAAIDPTKCQ